MICNFDVLHLFLTMGGLLILGREFPLSVSKLERFVLENYCYSTDGMLLKIVDKNAIYIPNLERKVLNALLKYSAEPVNKQLVIKEAWGHLNVSDESLTRCVYSLRKFLADNGKGFIKTIYSKGYLLRSVVPAPKYLAETPFQGVLIYPFLCENALEIQHSLIKSLAGRQNVNVYPASLIEYETTTIECRDVLKVMGRAISKEKMRLDIVNGTNNFLLDSEIVDNNLNEMRGFLSNVIPKFVINTPNFM